MHAEYRHDCVTSRKSRTVFRGTILPARKRVALRQCGGTTARVRQCLDVSELLQMMTESGNDTHATPADTSDAAIAVVAAR
ncbi:hypothetical protein [Streptomyces johnsoniae]|uniref:Uncharacterized protein n=1 Tax=Streptomyces johnsoniae TaxID=3075532 RepID=A0ABU2RXI3_9ACTN|nr:hypothetical protein [Streptomyces sp. DSM 41886]MDT0441430.1 hypothetical protein [Streptomyces sp. DSM 41886]